MMVSASRSARRRTTQPARWPPGGGLLDRFCGHSHHLEYPRRATDACAPGAHDRCRLRLHLTVRGGRNGHRSALSRPTDSCSSLGSQCHNQQVVSRGDGRIYSSTASSSRLGTAVLEQYCRKVTRRDLAESAQADATAEV